MLVVFVKPNFSHFSLCIIIFYYLLFYFSPIIYLLLHKYVNIFFYFSLFIILIGYQEDFFIILYLSIRILTIWILPQVVASCSAVVYLGNNFWLTSSPMFSLINTSSMLPAMHASFRDADILLKNF